MHQLQDAENEIRQLLNFVAQKNASDLHLKVGIPPYVRIGGHLHKVDSAALPDSKFIEDMMRVIIPPERHAEYVEHGGLDFACRTADGQRFRVNVYRSNGEMTAALRRVQPNIPDFDELNLPAIYHETISKTMLGLVLVSGVTGSGKSSTLAAMLDWIIDNRDMHIVTIEDPVEYSFDSRQSIISQREIGLDSPSFGEALRYVVRQDPDCIMIGEMRDRETMLAALQAAETGHLVLGSIHSSNVQQTFSRILEFFRREEHTFIRSSLAASLVAIMSQRLLPGIKKGSRLPATEVLLGNSLVREKISREEDADFPAIIYGGREEGMRSYTHSLCELVMAERVAREVALDYAPNRDGLVSMLKGIKTGGGLVGRMQK